LLDEAVSSLDVSVQAAILALLQDLRERPEEPAFLYISHDLATVAGFVDEMIVFYSGKVLEHGPVREILNGPHHPYTEVLLRSVPGEIALTSQAIKTLEMPVLANAGCVFASRCPWRIGPICEETEPPLKMLSPLHKSRCHYDGPELITLAKSDREKAKKHVQ
jgi:peptide/nickel transport system ATP-binding protein